MLAKASPRPTPDIEPEKDIDEGPDTNEAAPPAESAPANARDGDKSDQSSSSVSTGRGTGDGAGHGGGSTKSSELASYGRMLHDRFYSEWSQPTSSVASAAKISTLVRVRIEKDGRVSHFEIVRPSGNVLVDESVEAMGKRVTHVDPLPSTLRSSGHYDLKINFELNSD